VERWWHVAAGATTVAEPEAVQVVVRGDGGTVIAWGGELASTVAAAPSIELGLGLSVRDSAGEDRSIPGGGGCDTPI
jgi:hypothetical protein